MKKKLIELKWEIDKFSVIGGDFSTPHSEFATTRRQKISGEIGLELHCQPTWFNWYLNNSPLNNKRKHIPFKLIQNISQDRPYSKPKKQVKKILKSHKAYSLRAMELN